MKITKKTAYVFRNGRQWWYYDENNPDASGTVGPFDTKRAATESAKNAGFTVVYK
jgi:hypothetical protein